MNISRIAASRARSVESSAFFPERVSHIADEAPSLRSSASPCGWIFRLRGRLLTTKSSLGSSARLVLATLLEHVDADGRTWVGIETIAEGTGFGSTQTVRNALEQLAEAGFLLIVPQTWSSLTAAQVAVGRKPPRRGDVGQAPNLYVVLDGKGHPACGRRRPELAQVVPPTPPTTSSTNAPPQISEERPYQNQDGEPLSDLIGDLDPSEDGSMNESVENAPSVDRNTHISSKSFQKTQENLDAWNVVVEAHVEKTKAVYGVAPLRPTLTRDQQQDLAASLDGVAADVCAKLHARTGVEHDISEVRRTLAARVMNLYFKRDNEHLRRVKHALRDLPREFHARIVEAMQQILRESHDVTPPRRAPLEQPAARIVSTDKPAEIPQQTPPEEPKKPLESVDKPVEVAKQEPMPQLESSFKLVEVVKQEQVEEPKKSLEKSTARIVSVDKPAEMSQQTPPEEPKKSLKPMDKPVEVAPTTTPKRPSQQQQEQPSLRDTARESQRILEMLNALPSQEELFKPSTAAKPPFRPPLSERIQAALEQARASEDKPSQDKPSQESFEQKPFDDKASPAPPRATPIERPLGRSGAPRWGAIGPRPTKVRRVSRLVPDDAESEEEHGGGLTPPE